MVMGGGYNLGSAYGRVIIDTSGIDAAMQQAQSAFQRGLSGLSNGLQGIGQQMQDFGGQLTLMTAPLAAFGAQGISAAADFDTLMRQIEVFGGTSGSQLETVRQLALQMGADTKFSASDAATAMLDMLKAGMSLEDTMSAVRVVLDLAAAGNLSLAQAGGIVTSAMAQFGLRATDTTRISNALAAAANASRADVSGLGLALNNVGPIASSFGLSIEDTTAILAVFANNGVMGAEAGTQLRSMLMNMSENTATTQGAWEELGVSLYNADGSMRDMNTVIQDLDRALDRLPVEDQNRLMQALGGAYGVVGLTALRTAGGITDMRAAMEGSASAADVAAAFTDTFAGRMESLRGSVETLQIEALTPLMNDVLAPLVDRIIEVVNGVTEWVQANPQLASQIVQILGVVTLAGPALLAVGTALRFIGTSLAFVTGPVGLVIAAVAGLYLAFENNFLGIRDVLQPFLDEIGRFFEVLQGRFGEGGLQGVLGWLFSPDEDNSSGLAWLIEVFGVTEQASQDFVVGLQNIFNGIGDVINTYVMPAIQLFVSWFTGDALPQVGGIVQNVGGLIGDLFGYLAQAWAIVQPGLTQLADWFVNQGLPSILNFISGTVLPAINDFISLLRAVWSEVAPYLLNLLNWFVTDGLPRVVAFVRDEVIPRLQEFVTFLAGIWESVRPTLEQLYNWFVTDALPAIRDFIVNEVIPRIGELVTTISNIWTTVQPTLTSLWDWFTQSALPAIRDFIVNQVIPRIQEFVTTLQNIWTSVQPALQSLSDGVSGIFTFLRDNVIQPVINLINGIPNAVQTAIDSINRIPNTLQGIQSNASTITSGLASGQWNLGQVINAAVGAIGAEFRADGGSVSAMTPYVVGERGPELFVPGSGGSIVPNDAMGGTQITVSGVTINANSYAEGQAAARGFSEQLTEIMRSRG